MSKPSVAFTSTLVVLVTALAQAQSSPPALPSKAPLTVVYKGKMVDENGRPVSGIFPLQFKLFKGPRSRKSIWSESWWVAVDSGSYQIRLGTRKPLPRDLDLSKLVIGIYLKGEGELLREPFSGQGIPATSRVKGPAPYKAPQGEAKYAETAGYAVEAEHAKNADRLQGLTVEDLASKLQEAGIGQKVGIGRTRRYGTHIGGPGGLGYEDTCPRGYVMVGIRGGAGKFVDSIEIVCAPLTQ